MTTTGRHTLAFAAIGFALIGAVTSVSPAAALTCQPVALQLEQQLSGEGRQLSFADLAHASGCPTPTQAFMAKIADTLTRGGVVFLGEVHDNGLHHSARGLMLQHLARQAPPDKIGLVFEHIRDDQAAALAGLPRGAAVTAEAFFSALQWKTTGWPDQTLFEPLFEPALMRIQMISPGEPERARVRDVSRRGLSALAPGVVQALKLDQPWPAQLQDALLTELEASHCGLVPKAAFSTMALAQRYRDAHLAAAALAALRAHGSAIVFAGNGHARRDRGAPEALARLASDVPVLVVQFVEEAIAATSAAIADVRVVTPPAPRTDPCIEMRARFNKAP